MYVQASQVPGAPACWSFSTSLGLPSATNSTSAARSHMCSAVRRAVPLVSDAAESTVSLSWMYMLSGCTNGPIVRSISRSRSTMGCPSDLWYFTPPFSVAFMYTALAASMPAITVYSGEPLRHIKLICASRPWTPVAPISAMACRKSSISSRLEWQSKSLLRAHSRAATGWYLHPLLGSDAVRYGLRLPSRIVRSRS